tara:strand:- start:1187 stop:1744 length:558 start_codon:yes stop_codon:yes gene_type:complete
MKLITVLMLFSISFFLLSCVPQKVRVYKEPISELSIIDDNKQLVQVRDISWKIPTHWKKLPPQKMRLDGYTLSSSTGESVTITISVFPTMEGQLLANINRWRGQLQLSPIVKAELSEVYSKKVIGSTSFGVCELSSPKINTNMMVAIASFHDQDYFFKITGDSKFMAQMKSQFISVLESVTHVPH